LQKIDIYSKNIEDLNFALKRHKAFKERIQRKLLLVSKERDCFKQLLENMEKDLTSKYLITKFHKITNLYSFGCCFSIVSNTSNTIEVSGHDNQLRARIDMLEKTLIGYKEMCATLERELNTAKQLSSSSSSNGGGDSIDNQNIEILSQFGYDDLKRELDTLRIQNDRLRRRKEELELELEHRCLKGDFNMAKFKIIHLSDNPAAEAYRNSENFIEKLQAEVNI